MNDKPLAAIGFDLGHGETAVAMAAVGSSAAPEMLHPGDTTRMHVTTAVAIHPTRGVLVGDDAVTAPGVEHLWVPFKGPNVKAEDVAKPTTLFVRKVLENLTARGLDLDEVEFYVGAPSGWSRPVVDAYRALLRSAGMRRVDVVRESRAAFLHAREAHHINVSHDDLTGSVLIVDIGSSTTDFTAVARMREYRPEDSGSITLGARLLEKRLLGILLDRYGDRDVVDVLTADATLRSKVELACRGEKETFFGNEERYRADPDDVLTVSVRLGVRTMFIADVNASDMDAVLASPLPELDGRTWPEEFRRELAGAIEGMGVAPGVILLTGGGSLMPFVQKITKEVAGDVRVVQGAEPQYAIARGLALAGRIAHRSAGFRAAIDELIASEAVEQAVERNLPPLVEAISRILLAEMPERATLPAVERWRVGKLRTLNDVKNDAAESMAAWLTTADARMVVGEAVGQWFTTISPDIASLTDPICARYDIPKTAMVITGVDQLPTGGMGDTVDPSKVLGEAFEDMASVVGVISSVVLATLLAGAGHAALATLLPILAIPVVGPAIVFLVSLGIAAVFIRGGRSAIEKRVGDSVFPVWVRKVVPLDKLRKQSEDPAAVEKSVTAMVESFMADAAARSALCAGIATTVESVLAESGERVQMLIA